MRRLVTCCLALSFLAPLLAGCQRVAFVIPGASWHAKCGWKAEDYFDDPQVVALCQAIEANDIAEIDRLVAAGADVNAQGQGKMTPLLWAFPDNKLERFKRLLELGANPNVIFESSFNTHGGVSPGGSITHMACKTEFPGYFEQVFLHGGDPNLILARTNYTPLFTLISGVAANKPEKIKMLLEKGADINYSDDSGVNAALFAAGTKAQYDIALMLLEAGADYRLYPPKNNSRLIHRVIKDEKRLPQFSPQKRAEYRRLVDWLTQHGESVQDARADNERWRSWSTSNGEYVRNMEAEVAARKAREAHEAAAK